MPVESQPENAPVAGRITKGQQASIDELSQYYASKTPDRAKVLKSDAIDSLASRLINKGVPVQEANAIASKTFSKLRKGVSGALQVISGMGLSDLSRMAGTGKPSVERRPHINQNWLTSAFEAFATDEGLALMKAQQVATQLNKADQAKAAAGESVEAARASGVRQSTMQQGMEFVLGEMNADRKAFGTSLREDLDSPPRVYASVGEGQKFGGQGNYNVFFEWKKETPMVVTSHHHYGVANGVTGIHAQGNIGDKNARSFGNPSAEKYDTLPSGKQVLDTHLLVGNQGVPDARAHQLTVSIPDSSLSGIRSVYKEKGAAGVEAELNRIAVSQMVGTKSQGKTKAFTSKEGIPPMVAIQKNRTEAYVLNPDLANVASVTIVSNSPKEVALIRKNLENAFAKNGSALPKVKVVSAESGASGNVGRKAITDEYFKLTGEQRYMPSTIQREVGRNVDFANPPTEEKAKAALSSSKQPFWREHESLPEGSPVGVRIDIPAFLNKGTYVQTIHEPATPGNVGDRIGYDTNVRLSGPVRFFVKEGSEESKLGAVAIKEGRATKHPIATVEGRLIKDRSIPSDIETWTPVGMDPEKHSYFYDKRTDQPVTGGSESFSVGNTVFVKNPVYGKPQDFRYMPSPDSAMPGAYSFQGGYRAIPGKTKGSFRLYGPAGSLIGIASSLDEAQRILRRKTK